MWHSQNRSHRFSFAHDQVALCVLRCNGLARDCKLESGSAGNLFRVFFVISIIFGVPVYLYSQLCSRLCATGDWPSNSISILCLWNFDFASNGKKRKSNHTNHTRKQPMAYMASCTVIKSSNLQIFDTVDKTLGAECTAACKLRLCLSVRYIWTETNWKQTTAIFRLWNRNICSASHFESLLHGVNMKSLLFSALCLSMLLLFSFHLVVETQRSEM